MTESSYRHQLQADIEPFEGLLLGLFFTAIGMSLKLDLLAAKPLLILALTIGLLAAKAAILFVLGRMQGLDRRAARRLALVVSQGGEFAFVLLTQGVGAGVLGRELADLIAVVVTLSMAATPLLLLADELLAPARSGPAPATEALPDNEAHVIIAGFGRVGQIAARILRAKRIPFTALDLDAEQLAFVEKFGSKAFYGDASRLEILEAANAGKARALLLAIDDVEASVRTAELVRKHYPELRVIARARNRNHVHRLMDAGVDVIRRETYLSALDMTREVLRGLGHTEREIKFVIDTFQTHDQRRLIDAYRHYTDVEKLQELARSDASNLAKLFDEDQREQSETVAR